MNNTICALATPAGGAIAIIRVSGNSTFEIIEKIFRAKGGKQLNKEISHTIHYGNILDEDQTIIDDVLLLIFKAPHSYTGEDSVEISCHGSQYIINRIIQRLILNGCKQADHGEYTQRAFLNGKMDLSQAEAVADLIAATNRASHQMALSQLRGNFSNELSSLRNQLLEMTSLIELELDFSDQDVNFADRDKLLNLAQVIQQKINLLAQSFKIGNAIKQGVPVAIIGKTNVGKSTLLNRLLNEEKAIVSDVHGTTRDSIEDISIINGITFRFIDTAGLRKTEDKVEQLGIERTYQKIHNSAIVIWVVDNQPSQEMFKMIINSIQEQRLIIVQNKIDENPPICLSDARYNQIPFIAISAKENKNIKELEKLLYQVADIPEIKENDVIITNSRHYEALLHASDSISQVILGLKNGLSGDLLSEYLHDCIHALGQIVGGEILPEETLQSIFKRFCIGK